MDFRFLRAIEEDLPFIMETERLEGYEELVGRWDEARHREALFDGSHAYFLGVGDSTPVGFVILRHWASAERVTLVKRIAVVATGQGHGRMLLAAAVDRAFIETDAYRLCIGLSLIIIAPDAPTRQSDSWLRASREAARFSMVWVATSWSWRNCGPSGNSAGPGNQSRLNFAITGT